MEENAKNVLDWLQNQVSKAEAKDPMLRPLKDKINEVTEQLRKADESEFEVLKKNKTRQFKH